MSFGEEFKYSVLKDELVIGEVYIRVYNEQPTFVLEDPKGFATAVLDFIGSNAQVMQSLMLCTVFYCVLLYFTVFYYVLLCFTVFYCVLLCFTVFYCVLLCFTMFYCVLLYYSIFIH